MNIKNIILVILLSICAIEDIKEKEVSMPIVLGAGALGIIVQYCLKIESVWSILGGMSVGVTMVVLSLLTRGKIGLGDGILLMTTGIYLGLKSNFILLSVALLGVALWGVMLIALKKISFQKEIPFVPFMWMGYVGMLIL